MDAAAVAGAAGGAPLVHAVEDRWVACDRCEKWRRVTDESVVLPDQWFCEMNTWDPARASCDAEEENSEDDNEAQALLKQQQQQQAMLEQQAATQAAAAKRTPAKAGGGGGKRRKKKGSDDEDEDSATDSADEAFYASIDDGGGVGGRGRRAAARASTAKIASEYVGAYDSDDSSDDGGNKKNKRSHRPSGPGSGPGGPRVPLQWSDDADDALLSALIEHGAGAWTRMLADPRYAARLEGYKASHLRNRWRKLGTQEFDAHHKTLEIKREQALARLARDQALAQQPKPSSHQQQHQAAQMPSQQQQQQQFQQQQYAQPAPQPMMQQQQQVAPAVQAQPPPPTQPFTSYRPYPTHIFDMKQQSSDPSATGVKTEGGEGDAPTTKKGKKKKKGKKNADDDESDFEDTGENADDSDADSEAKPVKPEANEFADLDANLDNVAYMWYYDHRNSALQLYDTFSLPVRELKRQLVASLGMPQQDALEIMRAMGDARDLYSRRNILSKAIHAHLSDATTSSLVRQWCAAMRQMTTQHVHAAHDLQLRSDQAKKRAQDQQAAEYYAKHGVPMPMPQQQEQFGDDQTMGSGALKKEPGATPAKQRAAPPMPLARPPVPAGSTAGLQALEKLPYYWRTKLYDAKRTGGAFPEVTGSTPAKALLQMQLDDIKQEWLTPEIHNAIMSMRIHQNQHEKPATGKQQQQQHTNAAMQPQQQAPMPGMPTAVAVPSGGMPLPGMASVSTMPANMTPAQWHEYQQRMMQQGGSAMPQQPFPMVAPTVQSLPEEGALPTTTKSGRKVMPKASRDAATSSTAAPASSRKRRAAAPADDDEDVEGVLLEDTLYPLPNIRLRRQAPGRYYISRIVERSAEVQPDEFIDAADSAGAASYQHHQHAAYHDTDADMADAEESILARKRRA